MKVVAAGVIASLAMSCAGASLGSPTSGVVAPLTLEQIMADPDWIGPAVRDAYWSVDGRAVYYSAKRHGSPVIDLHRVEVSGRHDTVVDAAAMAGAEGPPVFDVTGSRAAFVRHGDVFLKTLRGGRVRQITRSGQAKGDPQFSADGRILSFRAGPDWWMYDERSGVTTPVATLLLEKDPDAPLKPDDLRDTQLRIFTTLARQRAEADLLRHYADAQQRADPSRPALPFYLGEDVSVLDTSLSPDAHWLLVVTEPKPGAGAVPGKLTRYVTPSGYEEFGQERARVGRDLPASQSVWLFDLAAHTQFALPLDGLPGIHDDPLSGVRAENTAAGLVTTAKATAANGEAAGSPPTRTILVVERDPEERSQYVAWSRDGRSLAVQLRAADHKDLWLTRVDLERHALATVRRESDAAWVGGRLHDFGWLNDGRTLWYVSEATGFAQIYTQVPGAPPVALTSGRFELSDPQLSPDGRWLYALGNREAPYAYDVYRVATTGGPLERVTRLGGVESFQFDRLAKNLLVTHSSSYIPSQLAVTAADGADSTTDLTDTRTAQYRALNWIQPEIVAVPSSHFSGVIYAKVYGAAKVSRGAGAVPAAAATRPAVIFVHGAGYTQDVHLKFPYYFREQMFNNLLVQKGYVVIDLDYRASLGYGRDWRTASYRDMGHPELDDLLDGKAWMVQHAGVDPERVGIYGGSYGGFMTLMALFRTPGQFAAGAALRPVTDWMQYEEGYTAEILNDPQVDPLAYRRSSPLEYAAGLRDALLICHGVVDDNVFFEDSMRLYERLIELHKDRFSLSPYPLDSHGFINADSWLDEYKRVLQLFESNLR